MLFIPDRGCDIKLSLKKALNTMRLYVGIV